MLIIECDCWVELVFADMFTLPAGDRKPFMGLGSDVKQNVLNEKWILRLTTFCNCENAVINELAGRVFETSDPVFRHTLRPCFSATATSV